MSDGFTWYEVTGARARGVKSIPYPAASLSKGGVLALNTEAARLLGETPQIQAGTDGDGRMAIRAVVAGGLKLTENKGVYRAGLASALKNLGLTEMTVSGAHYKVEREATFIAFDLRDPMRPGSGDPVTPREEN